MVKKIPIPMAGLILGTATLGNVLVSYGSPIRMLLGLLAGIFYVLYWIKLISSREQVNQDLNNVVLASVFPTFSMSTMVLSTYLVPLFPRFAYFMWFFGLLFHICAIIWFTMKFVTKKDIKLVFPSWYVVFIGIAVAGVTGKSFGVFGIGQASFWFGLSAYIILLPIVCYRVVKVKNIPEPAFPSIMILTAPGGLLLAALMNSFEKPNLFIVFPLMIVALGFYSFVLTQLPKILKLKFYPSISAITFPTVITAMGFKLCNDYLTSIGTPIFGLGYLVKFMEAVAVFAVMIAWIRYSKFFRNKPNNRIGNNINSQSSKRAK